MARNVYVTALEPGSGKSAVVLGLIEVLSRRAGRLGYFRPLIGSGPVSFRASALACGVCM